MERIYGYYAHKTPYKKMSNEEMLDCIRNNDFERLLSGCMKFLRRIAIYYCNEFDYEDRFQEAIIGMWLSLEKFDETKNEKVNAYLSKCVARHMKKWSIGVLREKRKLDVPGNSVSLSEGMTEDKSPNETLEKIISRGIDNEVEESVMFGESIEEVKKKINNVDNSRKRVILTLALLEDREHSVIGEELGVSRQYVADVVSRFRRELNRNKMNYFKC